MMTRCLPQRHSIARGMDSPTQQELGSRIPSFLKDSWCKAMSQLIVRLILSLIEPARRYTSTRPSIGLGMGLLDQQLPPHGDLSSGLSLYYSKASADHRHHTPRSWDIPKLNVCNMLSFPQSCFDSFDRARYFLILIVIEVTPILSSSI
jgi:hypothetical protein